MNGLGKFFEAQQKRSRTWLILAFVILAALAAGNFFMTSPEPHFHYDAYPEFWPIFGFGAASLMILFMKKIVQPLIERPEDYYPEDHHGNG